MRKVVVAVMLSLGASAQLSAQERISVADALSFLVTTQAVDTGDAARDRAAAEATGRALSKALLAALATLPLTSSSSGFDLPLQPGARNLGTWKRQLRPLLRRARGHCRRRPRLPRRQLAVRELHEARRHDASRRDTRHHCQRLRDETQPFDVETLELRIRTQSFTVSGVVGLTDRLDISAAVPIVSLSMEGSRLSTSPRRAVPAGQCHGDGDAPGRHPGSRRVQPRSRGVGGLLGGWRSSAADRRRGRPRGRRRARGARIRGVSGGTGIVSSHFTAASAGEACRTGSISARRCSVNPAPHVTIAGELFGRRLALGRLEQIVAPHPAIPAWTRFGSSRPTGTPTQTLAAIGVRVEPVGCLAVQRDDAAADQPVGPRPRGSCRRHRWNTTSGAEGQRTSALAICHPSPARCIRKVHCRDAVSGSRLPTFGT